LSRNDDVTNIMLTSLYP